MPLQHLQPLAVFQADDVVGKHRFPDRYRRVAAFPSGARGSCPTWRASCKRSRMNRWQCIRLTRLLETCAETICAVKPKQISRLSTFRPSWSLFEVAMLVYI